MRGLWAADLFQFEVSLLTFCFTKIFISSKSLWISFWQLDLITHSKCKIYLSYPNILKSLNPLQHQLKFKISSKYHYLKIPKSHHLNQGLDETLGINNARAKFLSIYRPAKLENKLSAPKVPWWDWHKIAVTDIPFQKGNESKKGVIGPNKFWNQTANFWE